MKTFQPAKIGDLLLKNRIIRSATYEGMCDENGFPTETYKDLYTKLAENNVGVIITGFAYISRDGRSMQTKQAGIDSEEKIPFYKKVTDEVHKYDCKIFIQIAHAGRQTLKTITGEEVKGVSRKKSFYFNEIPKVMDAGEILSIIEKFSNSALFAQKAGFDGIQLHCAHGYLIHQFILSSINNRKDIFGIDNKTKIGTKFLEMTIDKIREKCGKEFPILVKISCGDDYYNGLKETGFINLIKFLDDKKLDGIEITYGTMDYPLNIFRGNNIPIDTILKHNPKYKIENKILREFWKKLVFPIIKTKIKRLTPMYNLPYAIIAKQNTNIPIVCVGGFRKGDEIEQVINNGDVDFVSLCRPFICEVDFVEKIKTDCKYISKCIGCNICAIMCDTPTSTRCYSRNI